MKKTIIILIIGLSVLTSFAQGSFTNYKAVISDNTGVILTNQSISVRFTIFDQDPNVGVQVFQEIHTTITDSNGIIVLEMGSENTADWNAINWGLSLHYIKTEYDIGNGFVDMGTSPFRFVPYANLALNSLSADTVNFTNILNKPTTLTGYGITDGITEINDLSDATYSGTSLFLGSYAGNNGTGSNTGNTAIGVNSLSSNTTGTRNTTIGAGSLQSNGSGYHNVAVGYRSGFLNTGNYNVFIGSQAGYYETGSQNLYIDSQYGDADNALIYGYFGPDQTSFGNILRTNSQFQIGNPSDSGYAFPKTDGSANQILITDGNGSLTWQTPTTTQTKTINYPANAFFATSNLADFNNGVSYVNFNNDYGAMSFFINLPVGANITNIKVYYRDNSSGSNIKVVLVKSACDSGYSINVSELISSGSSTEYQYFEFSEGYTIFNSFAYSINISSDSGPWVSTYPNNTLIYGMTITYDE